MSKKRGYARCSLAEEKGQDLNRQVRELKAAGAEEIITEREHGDANVCMNAGKMNGFSPTAMANGFPTRPCDTKPASPVRKRELNTEGNTYSGTHSPRIAITKGWM